MMHAINVITGAIVSGVLWPFRTWPPIAGLTLVSLIAALLLLAAFKATSNQTALAAVKRKIQAGLFELRLFQDDPYTVLRVVGDLFRQQAVYLRYALVPLLWIAIPLTLVCAQLQAHYGYEGLRPGESALVTVRFKPAATGASNASAASGLAATATPLRLIAPDGVRVDTPFVSSPSLREAACRITATKSGDFTLQISFNGQTASDGNGRQETVTKQVDVTAGSIVPRAAIRPAASVWQQVLYPAEAPLPSDSALESIEVSYPERAFHLFGVPLHWLLVFFALSTAFALAFRSTFKVSI